MKQPGIAVMLIWVMILSGCATVPPETVIASRQIENNIETIRENNIVLLDQWYELSVDYWTEKVATQGADKILEKAKKEGIAFDMTKDYNDLVQQVLLEYRKNFLAELHTAYQDYRDKIQNDYEITLQSSQKLTALLDSVVKVEANRSSLLGSMESEIGIKDDIKKIQDFLTSTLSQ